MGLFSERLRLLRLKKGFTQQEVAQKIGVAKSTISQYEKGSREPNYETLEKIANFFNVGVDYLLGRTDLMIEYTEKNDETMQNIYDYFALLFAKENFTPEEMEEIKNYIEYIKSKRK